jgi:hypothetical protein
MSDRDLLVSIQTQLNDYLSAVTPIVEFYPGVPQWFTFTTQGGMVDLTISTVSGSYARKVVDSCQQLGFVDRVTGTPFSPFRHKAILQPVSAGTYVYQVTLDQPGRFMLQCMT